VNQHNHQVSFYFANTAQESKRSTSNEWTPTTSIVHIDGSFELFLVSRSARLPIVRNLGCANIVNDLFAWTLAWNTLH
jgi:hypothetical protein